MRPVWKDFLTALAFAALAQLAATDLIAQVA